MRSRKSHARWPAGSDALDAAFAAADPLTSRAERHAATMTGELCELFPDRTTGVHMLVDRLQTILPPGVRIWMGPHGLGGPDEARADPMSVASTNFLASAALVAQHFDEAVLIDMGSTTTDIIPIAAPRLSPRALTDGERLATGELVYSGLTRTDVSAIAHAVVFRSRRQRLAAGSFATMADVRRILGELPDGVDQHATADGRGKSMEESLARFARCFGRDRRDANLADWRDAARLVANEQMQDIRLAFEMACDLAPVAVDAPVVAAGIGAPVHRARRSGARDAVFASSQRGARVRRMGQRCAPAVAVALLAEGA